MKKNVKYVVLAVLLTAVLVSGFWVLGIRLGWFDFF